MKGLMQMAAISTIVAAAGVANAGGSYSSIKNAPAGSGSTLNREFHITRLVDAISANVAAPVNAGASNRTALASTVDPITGVEKFNFGGGRTAHRIFDRHTSASVLNLFNGSSATSTDQLWQDGVVNLDVRARYSSVNQHLGVDVGSNSAGIGDQGALISVLGTGNSNTWFNYSDPVDNTPSNIVTIGSASPFRWIWSSFATGFNQNNVESRYTSVEANNPNTVIANTSPQERTKDRMVAFELFDSIPGQRRYVIGFEDGTDFDYQDLVVEIVIAIPLPTGAAMGMAGMGLLAIRRRSAR